MISKTDEVNRQMRLRSEFDAIKEETKPQIKTVQNLSRAFFVGGGICALGKFIKDVFMTGVGLEEKAAGSAATICLIFLTAFLTTIGVFDRIGRYAGAGTYVPISGFANSIVSSAIEYHSEGMVFGTGSLMFKVAGPVLVYGIVSSWIVGFIYYVFNILLK
jgi:stage V sporulation protein AC